MRFSLALVVAATTILVSCSSKESQVPAPIAVSTAVPLQRDIMDWDEYIGRFEAIEDVEVKPRISGTVTAIGFRPGVEITKGAMLFQIDPRPYRAALEQARAELMRSRATLTNARSERDRAAELRKYEAVSKEEYESKQAVLRSAGANVAAAQAAVETRRLDLEFTTIRAPITGRISDKRVALGDYVSSGETLLTRIVSLNPIWFSFEGAESFYLKYIRQAQHGERESSRYAPNPVEIQLADETGYHWRGQMTFVDNAIDTNSGTIRAHAVVANPEGFLVPGMFGRARLLGSGTYKALLVPDEAIVADQDRKLVYVVGKNGKSAVRLVETGPMVEGLRVIRQGLAPTERVIIDGLTRIQPGMPVTPRQVKITPRAENTSPDSIPAKAPVSVNVKAAH
ncbi:MAG: efflux RND transporter periplasmic adaptor subunit [Alphaproteobacteria bacterium]|nr:efflux RND transporter periplasmic adaptor subunit [Alphaproteobacteria bacterium]